MQCNHTGHRSMDLLMDLAAGQGTECNHTVAGCLDRLPRMSLLMAPRLPVRWLMLSFRLVGCPILGYPAGQADSDSGTPPSEFHSASAVAQPGKNLRSFSFIFDQKNLLPLACKSFWPLFQAPWLDHLSLTDVGSMAVLPATGGSVADNGGRDESRGLNVIDGWQRQMKRTQSSALLGVMAALAAQKTEAAAGEAPAAETVIGAAESG